MRKSSGASASPYINCSECYWGGCKTTNTRKRKRRASIRYREKGRETSSRAGASPYINNCSECYWGSCKTTNAREKKRKKRI